jgi:nitric oxide reductase NorE protein
VSRNALPLDLGVVKTVLLVTSSWLVALAARSFRTDDPYRTEARLLGAIGCGIGFAAISTIEYHSLIADHHTLSTNGFFLVFFLATGINLAHIVAGTIVLFLLARTVIQPTPGRRAIALVECGATYWHLVVLVWVALFALLYVA